MTKVSGWRFLRPRYLLPAGTVALQPPAWRIPLRGGILGKQRTGAGLVDGSEVIIFRLVAFEGGGEELIDGYRSQARTPDHLAGFKDSPVEGIGDGQTNEQIL